MQICSKHWKMLRDGITQRGLAHLVSKDAETAVSQMQDELTGVSKDVDPLLTCHNMIFERGIELFGLSLMFEYPRGETGWGEERNGVRHYCPVCVAVRTIETDSKSPTWNPEDKIVTPQEEEKYWIDGPLDAVLSMCREKGLVRLQ